MSKDEEPSVRLDRPKPLEDMAVEELQAYAERLQAELEQVRATIDNKRQYISGAEGLFKF